MPNPWEVESIGQYGKNSERFPATKQYSWEDLQAWNALKTLPAGSPVPADPYSLVPPKPKGALENLLEMPSRPLAGISSGLGYALQGRNPLEGAWQGLQGQSQIKDITGVLEQQGVPEMGRLQVGPFDVTGRDVLGFGLGLAVDPMTYVGGGIGKLAGLSPKVAGIAAKVTAMGIPELPAWNVAKAMGGRVTEQGALTLKGQIAGAISKVPGGRTLMDLVDPAKVADTPAVEASITLARQRENGANLARAVEARLANMPFQLTPDGMSVDLLTKQVPWETVMSNPGKYASELTPAQIDYAKNAAQQMQALSAYGKLNGLDFTDLTFTEAGREYVPRVLKQGDNILPMYLRRNVGGVKTHQQERAFDTMEEAIKALKPGERYLSPQETFAYHARQVYQGVAEKQFADELLKSGIGTMKDEALLAGLTAEKGAAKQSAGAIANLASLISRAKRGEAVPVQSIAKYTEAFPEYAQRLQDALAVPVPDFVKSFKDFGDEAQLIFNKSVPEMVRLFRAKVGDRPVRPGDLRRVAGLLGHEDTNTVDMLTRIYQNSWRLASRDKTDILDSLSTAVRGTKAELGAAYKGARQALWIGKQGEEAKVEGLVSTSTSLTKGMYFEPETAKLLAERLRDTPNPIFKGIGDIGQISRLGMTGFDVGGMMIQGLAGLASHPGEWAKAAAASLRVVVDANWHNAYLARPKAQNVIAKVSGLIVSTSEPYEAVRAGGALGSLGKVARGVFAPFQRSFDTFGDVYRIEVGDALMPAFERAGQLPALGDFLNKSSGIISTAASGVMADQRAIESGMLFFAPRYLRASLALLSDVFADGGLKGWEARRAIGSMMFGGLAMYNKLALAAGQEPNLDPSDSRFLTVKVGDDVVGVGSIWTSLARLAGNMVAHPGDMAQWDMDKNPLMKWLRSRLPPTTSTAVDLITHETYLGDPIESPIDLAGKLPSKFLPFWAESRLIQNPPSNMATLPAEFAGAKVFPQSYKERREQLSQDVYKKSWDQLDPFEQQNTQERLKALGMPLRGEEQKARDAIFTKHNADLNTYAGMIGTEIGKNGYRAARNNVKQETSFALQALDNVKYEGMSAEQVDEAKKEEYKRLPLKEAARRAYYDMLSQKDPYTGEPDWDAAEAFLNTLPQEIADYIDDKTEARIKDLPQPAQEVEREFLTAKRSLKPYFDLFNTAMQQRGLLDTWKGMTPLDKVDFVQTPVYKAVQQQLGQQKEIWRLQHPKEDQMLVEWGYASKTMRQQMAERGSGGLGSITGSLSSSLSSPLSKGL